MGRQKWKCACNEFSLLLLGLCQTPTSLRRVSGLHYQCQTSVRVNKKVIFRVPVVHTSHSEERLRWSQDKVICRRWNHWVCSFVKKCIIAEGNNYQHLVFLTVIHLNLTLFQYNLFWQMDYYGQKISKKYLVLCHAAQAKATKGLSLRTRSLAS